MAINTNLQDHLDKRSGSLTYVASGEVAIITSASVPTQRIAELERIADVTGHELVVNGGFLQLQPKGVVTVGVFTVTIASPGVFTKVAHGLVAGNSVKFITSGALPTGLTAGVTYYVISAGLTADAFQVSLTPAGAAVNTSGTQSGTHTAYRST
jgi:hypothetical protein